jgi:arsenate reductase-like glutaredoxin family protein
VFKQPLTKSELESIVRRVHLSPREILSTRSRPYKQLGLADRELTDDEILNLMTEYPALIRRPLTVKGAKAVVGADRNQLLELVSDI